MEAYVPYIVIGMGIIFSVVGWFIIKSDRKIRTQGVKTLGAVVDVQEVYSSEGTSYRLTVEFTDRNGTVIRQDLDHTTGFKPKKAIPYETPIFYLQEKGKTKIALGNSKAMFLMGLLFLSIGIGLMAVIIIPLLL